MEKLMRIPGNPQEQNVSSSLLSPEENQKLFFALGKWCRTLSTTTAELYLTEEPHYCTWVKKFHGVVCFVKDYVRHSYFIKLFDMIKCNWIWEQDLVHKCAYKPACTYFHVLKINNCMVGLNFGDKDEALNFQSAIRSKLQQRVERMRHISKRRGKQSDSTPPHTNGREPVKKEKKNLKKKLTKEDISKSAVRVQHVGWDPKKDFAVESVDEELKAFFNMAGVSDNDLNDCDTRNFIYDFIANHGGVEHAKQEIVLKTEKSCQDDNVNKLGQGASKICSDSSIKWGTPKICDDDFCGNLKKCLICYHHNIHLNYLEAEGTAEIFRSLLV